VEYEGKNINRIDRELTDAIEEDPHLVLEAADAIIGNIDWYLQNLTLQTVAESVYDRYRDDLEEMIDYQAARHEIYENDRDSDDYEATRKKIDALDKPDDLELDVTVSLKGYNTSAGLAGVYVSILAALLLFIPTVAGVLKPWIWIGETLLFCGVVLLLLCTAMFMATSPGENLDVEKVLSFSQGIGFGSIVAVLGSLALLAGLAANATAGLKRLQRMLDPTSA
jgi:hypothetical protein